MHPAVTSPRLKDLLALDGPGFLGQAYLAVLDRPADPEGFRHYTERLRAGMTKLQVLAELRASSEGQNQPIRIEELAQALAGTRPLGAVEALTAPGLLALNDEVFVEQLHLAVVGAAPDPSLTRYRVAQLRAGRHKLQVVAELLTTGATPLVQTPLVQGLRQAISALQEPLFPVAATAQQLLELEDLAFIDCAYKTLLHRPADPRGLDHYLTLVRSGRAKLGVLTALQASAEGRAAAVVLPGLRRRVVGYLLTRVPVLGPLWATLFGIESEAPPQRLLRALHNILARNAAADAAALVRAEDLTHEVDRLLRAGKSAAVNPGPRH